LSNNKFDIPLDAPSLDDSDVTSVSEAINSGFVSTFGPYVGKFEKKLSSILGTEDVSGTQSGTSALHASLHSLGIREGDEVLVPDMTFIATANAVAYTGAKPIPVDIDKSTWNIDFEKAQASVNKKTRAIIPVHLFGNPVDIERANDFAISNKLELIFDAAEALGASINGKPCTSVRGISCLSFNGNKIITTGGGGAIAGPKEFVDKIRLLVNQARKPGSEIHDAVGFNYRMTNLEASLGLSQLEKLDFFLKKKRRFAEIYKENLAQIEFQKELPTASSSWWLTCAFLDSKERVSKVVDKLDSHKVQTRLPFRPLHLQPAFKCDPDNFKTSSALYSRGLCLPSSTQIDEEDVQTVCQLVRDCLLKEV